MFQTTTRIEGKKSMTQILCMNGTWFHKKGVKQKEELKYVKEEENNERQEHVERWKKIDGRR